MSVESNERSFQVRRELADVLQRFITGAAHVEDILSFEGPFAFDETLDSDLRSDLDGLALFAEEVDRDMRPLSDLRERAQQVLARASVRVGVVEEGFGVVD